ncbi:hypothetical protein BJ165DRAFT_1453545 [Panaeolus papilionaceus]|nr:hypothetical protein BJ165DRAFT_1453545 [Panaeolus papilionaceus]
MPKKWYVVTAGREIGVFSDWLEAAALVKGLDDAIYNSYLTEEEAREAFSLQEMKGNTQVIGDGRRFQPSSTVARTSNLVLISGTRRSNSSNSPRRLTASASMPSRLLATPPATPQRDRATPRQYSPSLNFSSGSHSHSSSPVVRSSESEAFFTPTSNRSPSLKSSEEKEAAKARRLKAIKQCYEEAALQETLANSPKSARSGTHSFYTPDSIAPTPRHSSLANKPRAPRAIVKTPDWILSYPEALGGGVACSEILSPLNLAGVSALPIPSRTPAGSKCVSPLMKYPTEPTMLLEPSKVTEARASSRTSDAFHSLNGNRSVSDVPVDPRSPIIDRKSAIRDMQFNRYVLVNVEFTICTV